MNRFSEKHLLIVIALAGLMIILGQTGAFAQATLQQQIKNGGFFQVIDSNVAPCSGQCSVGNWQTEAIDCTCPANYAPVQIGRTLVSVILGETPGECGASLFTCVWQEQ